MLNIETLKNSVAPHVYRGLVRIAATEMTRVISRTVAKTHPAAASALSHPLAAPLLALAAAGGLALAPRMGGTGIAGVYNTAEVSDAIIADLRDELVTQAIACGGERLVGVFSSTVSDLYARLSAAAPEQLEAP
jgi:hypothetical protein